MAEAKTPDRVREERLRDMGSDLGTVYDALCNEVTWIHVRWNLFQQLFAHSQQRLDLLYETAGIFFGTLRRVFREDTALALARLTDPPQSMGKENLTLRRLPELVPEPALRLEVEGLLQVVLDSCDFARQRRNRRLAHRDLGLSLKTSSDPLPGVNQAGIEGALGAIRELLNRLELHYRNSTMMFEFPMTGPGDAESLVYYLNQGLTAHRSRHQYQPGGKSLPQDQRGPESV